VAGALELTSYDPGSGMKLWSVDGLSRIVIPVPALEGEMIYTASWTPGGDPGQRLTLDPWPQALTKWDHNQDGKLARAEIKDPQVLERFYRMDLDQSGDLDQKEWERHAEVFRRAQNAALGWRAPERGASPKDRPPILVWKHQRGAPYVSSPLVHNGVFWMVKDGGIVTKLDAAAGQLLQEERLPGMGGYYASPVAGDGKVYFAGELGMVSILAETRDWRLISSHDFQEKIYATPVIEDGRIFIRTQKALYCFGRPLD
jgi:outer membrane protein assembly factor BamB